MSADQPSVRLFLREKAFDPALNRYLFIHGYSGDEHSMEIFARKLPPDALVAFARAPFPAQPTGFSWTEQPPATGLSFRDYTNGALALINALTYLGERAPAKPWRVCGFSQGAALALVFALEYPHEVGRVACLAGVYVFPPDLSRLDRLEKIPIYMAHGVADKIAPVEEAREAARKLEKAGLNVDWCENKGGHKLPLDCQPGLTHFLTG